MSVIKKEIKKKKAKKTRMDKTLGKTENYTEDGPDTHIHARSASVLIF